MDILTPQLAKTSNRLWLKRCKVYMLNKNSNFEIVSIKTAVVFYVAYLNYVEHSSDLQFKDFEEWLITGV